MSRRRRAARPFQRCNARSYVSDQTAALNPQVRWPHRQHESQTADELLDEIPGLGCVCLSRDPIPALRASCLYRRLDALPDLRGRSDGGQDYRSGDLAVLYYFPSTRQTAAYMPLDPMTFVGVDRVQDEGPEQQLEVIVT